MTTVSIADDHPITIQAVTTLIHRVPDFTVLHQCLSGAELLKKLETDPTDIVIVDFSMGHDDLSIDGFALIRKIRECAPASRIVLFTAQRNPSILRRALGQFANAVVCKEDALGDVIQACVAVRQGRDRYCSPIAKDIIDRADGDVVRTSDGLTPKELDVLRLYASGYSFVQIADQLGRAVSTISTQKYTAMRKLNLNSNTELIRYAYETGLI
ncbi:MULTISPECIES: response regulator transcription factor [unclassified Burkholderia]|uniref:response regulator transcription factor n=1 Tax=unclassified Burkholderia TaxID=2613784 RepID=UPI002ABE0B27|nr:MULTISPECIES: response regulator transcription factor [unclassified Burkholderia]